MKLRYIWQTITEVTWPQKVPAPTTDPNELISLWKKWLETAQLSQTEKQEWIQELSNPNSSTIQYIIFSKIAPQEALRGQNPSQPANRPGQFSTRPQTSTAPPKKSFNAGTLGWWAGPDKRQ